MRILVVSATEKEIQPFLEILAGKAGSVAGNDIEILVTGVGSVNTAYRLAKKLSTPFDLAIQAGIAGAFNEELKLGQVVAVERDAFGDLGTEEQGKFQTIFQSGLGSADEFPFTNGWLKNDNALVQKISLPPVRSVSVNRVTDNVQQKQQLISAFNPATESMEGAAFHYVCLQEKIAFIQLRAISNYVGERNKQQWKMKEAIENLNNEFGRIITAQ